MLTFQYDDESEQNGNKRSMSYPYKSLSSCGNVNVIVLTFQDDGVNILGFCYIDIIRMMMLTFQDDFVNILV